MPNTFDPTECCVGSRYPVCCGSCHCGVLGAFSKAGSLALATRGILPKAFDRTECCVGSRYPVCCGSCQEQGLQVFEEHHWLPHEFTQLHQGTKQSQLALLPFWPPLPVRRSP